MNAKSIFKLSKNHITMEHKCINDKDRNNDKMMILMMVKCTAIQQWSTAILHPESVQHNQTWTKLKANLYSWAQLDPAFKIQRKFNLCKFEIDANEKSPQQHYENDNEHDYRWSHKQEAQVRYQSASTPMWDWVDEQGEIGLSTVAWCQFWSISGGWQLKNDNEAVLTSSFVELKLETLLNVLWTCDEIRRIWDASIIQQSCCSCCTFSTEYFFFFLFKTSCCIKFTGSRLEKQLHIYFSSSFFKNILSGTITKS